LRVFTPRAISLYLMFNYSRCLGDQYDRFGFMKLISLCFKKRIFWRRDPCSKLVLVSEGVLIFSWPTLNEIEDDISADFRTFFVFLISFLRILCRKRCQI